MTDEAKPRVYDVLAKAFIQEGVSTCFTLMGDANINWAARLRQQGCRMVYVRHDCDFQLVARGIVACEAVLPMGETPTRRKGR